MSKVNVAFTNFVLSSRTCLCLDAFCLKLCAGFVCVRGFDRTLRAPRPLYARLHFPASKVVRGKKPGAAREEE